MPSPPPIIKILLILAKNCLKIEIKTFPHLPIKHVCFKYFVNNVGIKFQLKLTALIFCTKVAKKSYFQSKIEK